MTSADASVRTEPPMSVQIFDAERTAGSGTTAGWTLTFLWVLLPGVLIGGLLGWAEHRRPGRSSL